MPVKFSVARTGLGVVAPLQPAPNAMTVAAPSAVLADVLVSPEGKVFVMQSKPPFRRPWVERYIAADLKCIFGNETETYCPVRSLGPTHFIVERRWYKLDLSTVETKPGPQPAEMFDVTRTGKP